MAPIISGSSIESSSLRSEGGQKVSLAETRCSSTRRRTGKSVALVPAPAIAEDHPNAQDAMFVKQMMLARIGLDAQDWPEIEVRSLAGIRSSTIKPSWDDFKALQGKLARYEFRLAWCELPAKACARFKAYDALTAEDRDHETPGFATLKAIRSVARNRAANWDVYDGVERHFDGHLLCIPP
jgi:hypothetical protein